MLRKTIKPNLTKSTQTKPRLMMAGVAFAALAVSASAAAAQTHYDMISFGGASNTPVWVAQSKGFFKKEGLDMSFTTTRSSKKEIADFLAGKYQFMTTAFDNIVAYIEGQGDVKQAGAGDLVAIMGVHEGMNSVVARPEIKSFADIKGHPIAVDAVRSGYATVLYEILDNKAGLKFDKDYSVIAVGSTSARMEAMEQNKAVAAIINTPTDMEAQKKGYKILADATEAVGAYQGSAYVVSRKWAKAHEKDVMAYTRAVVAGHDYVYNNKAGTIEVLKAHIKGLSDADAERLYTRLTGPGGISKHAAISIPGVEKVLALRDEWSVPKTKSGKPQKYIDTSYQEKAVAQEKTK
ncbi:MAG TPA: ABC transporter substrate-binding protein [Xanthobacteraceae bacterium]|jgi:ABC-type nitrate/sulfonate/bicarbonate transport system substrate-binding protein|nr:ABC transporter substrate-binding protein [Xanthobacteraceae bacterium]